MFTQPCFIRKNTLEIREGLEDLGYYSGDPINYECDAICTFVRDGKAEYLNFKIDEDFETNIKDDYPFIDCGTNESKFLALAALRDDTDYMQYFICADYFVLCDRDDWLDMYSVLHCGHRYSIEELDNAHKATVEELIEHFKE